MSNEELAHIIVEKLWDEYILQDQWEEDLKKCEAIIKKVLDKNRIGK